MAATYDGPAGPAKTIREVQSQSIGIRLVVAVVAFFAGMGITLMVGEAIPVALAFGVVAAVFTAGAAVFITGISKQVAGSERQSRHQIRKPSND